MIAAALEAVVVAGVPVQIGSELDCKLGFNGLQDQISKVAQRGGALPFNKSKSSPQPDVIVTFKDKRTWAITWPGQTGHPAIAVLKVTATKQLKVVSACGYAGQEAMSAFVSSIESISE